MENKKWLNIVLFEPEIPANTGNIGRLCVGLNIKLHLIEPLGFKMTSKTVKRAGLDYWEYLSYDKYSSLEDFFSKNENINFYFASTKATKLYSEVEYKENDYIIFGRESAGLPEIFHTKYKEKGITLPMPGEVRSINLSNSCAVCAYEAYRQISLK